MIADTDGVTANLRVGTSGGIDSGATDYTYHAPNSNVGSANSYNSSVQASEDHIKLHSEVGANTGDVFGGTIFLQRNVNGVPTFSGNTQATKNITTGSPEMKGGFVFGARKAVINLDRVNFYFATGNIASGRMTVYGISHT